VIRLSTVQIKCITATVIITEYRSCIYFFSSTISIWM